MLITPFYRLHLKKFDCGKIRRDSDQPFGRRAVVADREIAGADLRAFGRRGCPRTFNCDVA
jgi:hypothetical protein